MLFILPTITRKELMGGAYWELSNAEGDTLEIYFCEEINHHTGRGFCLWFNGRLDSFKTIHGLKNRASKIIEEYKLIIQ